MFPLSKSIIAFSLLLLIPCLGAGAEEAPSPEPAQKELPAVIVVGTSERSQDTRAGESSLSSSEIERLPLGAKSISESVKVLPGVQLSEELRSSENGGEILPPEISISGGRPLQNNFSIDGLSNNSVLDPENSPNNRNSGVFIPDHAQTVFLDPDLVGPVSLYRSNVPARYGGFTGGVVDAQTRDPVPWFWGKVGLRGTRDEWATFHLLDEDREGFENSDSLSQHPNFTIYDGAATLNIPTGKSSGVLASYSKTLSRIETRFLDEDREQRRTLENIFLKWKYDRSGHDSVEATLIATPYEEELFYPNARNSDYTIEGGGTMLSLGYERFLDAGDLQVKGAYRRKRNKRIAPQHLFIWDVTPSKPWGSLIGSDSSREGMVGSIDMSQDAFQLTADLQGAPVHSGAFRHEIATGIDLERVEGRYNRAEETFQFYRAQSDPDVACAPGDISCIDGEQYFANRIIFPAGNAEASIDFIRLYVEDLISVGRFSLRPGLRFSFDDFQDNANLAPRLLTSYDIFDDNETVLFAGLNRYYGKVFLSYALREGGGANFFQRRSLEADNTPGPWTTFLRGTAHRYSQLKTPYADELSVGVMQRLFGGTGELQYIHRKGYDGYARQRGDREADGIRYYSLNNNGRSRHEQYTLSWEKQSERYDLRLNVTYQETSTSNIDYDDTFDLDDAHTWVLYEGEVLRKEELPRDDFNRPWIANLHYALRLPRGFEFTNLTRWRDGYEDIDRVFPLPADAPIHVTEAYERVERHSSWIFDWKLAWRGKIGATGELTLNLEILNVFNEKVAVGAAEDEFEMGRQFWAGAEYAF